MTSQLFGRYQIKSEIGRGGMATVYIAYDPSFEREVAIKVLPAAFLYDPKFRARFEREAKMIALLEHPAIVPVYDFGEQAGQPFIVMRYMAGGSLAERLENGPLSYEDTVQLVSRLAPALDFAHTRKIIHRDLKPGNILFDQFGNSHLSDFGIARMAQSGMTTMTGESIIGTPTYMSPEQIQGNKAIDGRSDIYAMGVLIYQMLTGEAPYRSDTPAQVMMMHILEPVPDLQGVKTDLPVSCSIVIMRAMAKDPDERYKTTTDLATALTVATQDIDINQLEDGDTLFSADTTMAEPAGSITISGPESASAVKSTQAAVPQSERVAQAKNSSFYTILIAILGVGALLFGGLYLIARQGNGPFAMLAFAPTTTITPPYSTLVSTPNKLLSQPTTAVPVAIVASNTPVPPSITPTVLPPSPTWTPTPFAGSFKACPSDCMDDGSNAISRFPNGTTRLHLRWSYKNIPTGAHYVRFWTMNGLEWVRYDCTWPGPANGIDEITLTEPGGLHSGTWEVKIMVNDQVIMHEQVYVDGDWSYWDPAGVFYTCYGTR